MTYQHFQLICGQPGVNDVPLPGERLSMSDALEDLFSADSGLLVMQWNGIFVPLDYKYDVSWILSDVLGMLEQLMDAQEGDPISVSFPSNGFNADWSIMVAGSSAVVSADWRQVKGSLLGLLTDRSPLTFELRRFLDEWLALLHIVVRSLNTAGFGSQHVYDYDRLVNVLNALGTAATDG